LDLRGDVAATLAEVLRAAGQFDVSRLVATDAVRLHEQKDNVVAAALTVNRSGLRVAP
jgi:hypothetical protein